MRTTIVLAIVLLAAMVLLSAATTLPGETTARLAFGWLSFIGRAAGRLAVNWSGVATALTCLLLLLLGGNYFFNGLAAASAARCAGAREAVSHVGNPAPMPESGRWPLHRTALLLAVVVLMFVSGTAFIGLVHQIAWLATAPEPLTRYRLRLGHRDYPLKYPRDQFMMVGMGYRNYLDVFKKSPTNGPAPALHEGSHSWQTRLLGFMPTSRDNIDFQKDWDDPKNAPAFRRFVPYFLNPDIGVLRERHGFAVSHFAGNRQVFDRAEPLSAHGGSAKTILCGEVVSEFKAWGDPSNLRDPSDGINASLSGFGGTDEQGAYFLMLDGSSRFIRADVDPRVLQALATPD